MHADKRAGALPVHIEVADKEFFFRPADLLRIVAEDRAGQAELRVVGDSQCIVEITRANHGQDRTKDLLLGDGGAWSNVADYRRLDEEAIFVAHSAAGQNLPAFAGTFVDVFLDLLHRRLIYNRSDLGLRGLGRGDFQRLRFLHDQRNEAVVNRVIDDQPRARRTLLSLKSERRGHNRSSGIIEILRFAVDDDGIFPAHLGDDSLDPDLSFAMLGLLFIDIEADLLRPGAGA